MNTVLMIKNYKKETGCSLKEALEYVNSLSLTLLPKITKPCPYCGKQLRTDLAKQCFECGKDWHN